VRRRRTVADLSERIANDFTHHPPKGDQVERYAMIRAGAKTLAGDILLLTPASREQSLALTNLEQAVMWANAAIARNE
jgi:hypothetical protein